MNRLIIDRSEDNEAELFRDEYILKFKGNPNLKKGFETGPKDSVRVKLRSKRKKK